MKPWFSNVIAPKRWKPQCFQSYFIIIWPFVSVNDRSRPVSQPLFVQNIPVLSHLERVGKQYFCLVFPLLSIISRYLTSHFSFLDIALFPLPLFPRFLYCPSPQLPLSFPRLTPSPNTDLRLSWTLSQLKFAPASLGKAPSTAFTEALFSNLF